jgi:PAS domain S-box-containing protein
LVSTSGMEKQVRQENEELRCRNAELSRQVADLETEIRAQFYRRQRHQEAMDRSVIPVTVINPDGGIKYVNHAFAEMTMFTAPGLVGSFAPYPWFEEKTRVADSKLFLRQVKGREKNFEGKFSRKDGRVFWCNVIITNIRRDGRLQYRMLRWIDISERKLSEVERKNIEQRVNLSSKLASIGEMVSGIAHEINNPLTMVVGYADLLLRRDIPEEIRGDVRAIFDGAERVAGIINRLLSFSRQKKPGRSSVDINKLISDTLEFQSYALNNANITVATGFDAALPLTIADGGQLQQVFLNIIMNAEYEMKYTRDGGQLWVKTAQRDGMILITFEDDGPGIAPAITERIFEPFFTTREVGQGTGLGLSVCHGIISEHNGRIYAQNRRGQGARFIIELPVTAQAMQLAMETAVDSQSANAAPANILVVDDEPSIRDFMKKVLEASGHRVDTVANGALALDIIESNRYDLLMLDIKMPGMNGIELYHHLKKTRPEMVKKIIFVTGDILGAGTREFIDRSKVRYITKPISIRKLEHCLNRAFSDGI